MPIDCVLLGKRTLAPGTPARSSSSCFSLPPCASSPAGLGGGKQDAAPAPLALEAFKAALLREVLQLALLPPPESGALAHGTLSLPLELHQRPHGRVPQELAQGARVVHERGGEEEPPRGQDAADLSHSGLGVGPTVDGGPRMHDGQGVVWEGQAAR